MTHSTVGVLDLDIDLLDGWDYGYDGLGTTTEVPTRFPLAINGRPFVLDRRSDQYLRQSVPILRTQADTSVTPGKQSLNPDALWPADMEDWSQGAGQSYRDREGSSLRRFHTSKGIDPWTKWQLTLLNDTTNRRSTSGANLYLTTAGSYLYVSDGNEVYFTSDITVAPTWTASVIFNGEAAQSVKSIASDGYYVYAALGSNGIHRSVRGATTSAHYSDLSCTLVAYLKGRLMAANGNAIYNVIAAGVAPSALFTHANTDFTWVGFAEGSGAIYAGGFSGDKSLIYRTAVVTDGTALAAPIVAGELPDGEILRSIQGYLGQYLMLGTDKGVRFCGIDGNSNLVIGSLIPTTSPVRCFEPQQGYVWFGQENYDSVSTGLGRMNLEEFTKTLTPAYASDLMATGQGAVLSVATFQNIRVFTVSGLGVYAETTNKVASGTIESGLITYGLRDDKTALSFTVTHATLTGSVLVSVAVDGGAFTDVGSSEGTGITLDTGQLRGNRFEVRLTLGRDGTTTTLGPTVTGGVLRAQPQPDRVWLHRYPLLLAWEVETRGGQTLSRSPSVDFAFLKGLLNQVVSVQEEDETFTLILSDVRRVPDHEDFRNNEHTWAQTILCEMKSLT